MFTPPELSPRTFSNLRRWSFLTPRVAQLLLCSIAAMVYILSYPTILSYYYAYVMLSTNTIVLEVYTMSEEDLATSTVYHIKLQPCGRANGFE